MPITPIIDHDALKPNEALLRVLQEIVDTVNDIERRLEKLEENTNV